jgi:uncharacterized protein YjiS (DUF1127 family)
MTARARPFVSQSGSGASMIRRLLDLALAWRAHSHHRRALSALDDRMLRDVGLTRADVYREVAKPFWRI